MSIADEIQRIQGNIDNMYDSLEAMGATMPSERNSANLVTSFASSPNLSDFLPSNTVINVKLDGTGDFTKLSDVASYLQGKYSNGTVEIHIGEGTFTETAVSYFYASKFNIPNIIILGVSKNSTILSYNVADIPIRFIDSSTTFIIRNLTIENIGGGWTLMGCNERSNVKIDTVTLIGKDKLQESGINAYRSTNVELGDYITIKNVKCAIHADQGGHVAAGVMNHGSFENCNYGWYVSNGSIINGISSTTPTYTNVTNKTNSTVNTINAGGIIMHIPV